MRHIIAVDQSTSASKAVLFDESGCVAGRAARNHRQIYPQPGWVEHDAEEIWRNVVAVLRELIAEHPDQLRSIVGLSITNQRETFVVFDRRTGRPLHPAIVWQCRRGDAICAELRDAGRADDVQARTGLELSSYFSAPKLAWLVREKPELAQQLRDGDALMGTIDAYLVFRLTGGALFATDFTNASRTLLFNVRQRAWDAELCELFQAPSHALPEIRESFASFGATDAEGALPSAVPICGVMGDSQASLFAQRCFRPGMAKVTLGTGASVLLNNGQQFRLSRGGAVSALAWVYQEQPAYAWEGLVNYASATIAWLRDQLRLIGDAAETEALAGAVNDNGGAYLVPAFAGLNSPHQSADARAAIVGMTAHTRKEHIVRAALEAIGYQIRDILQMMQSDGGASLRSLFADGGPTRNRFLMQFTADITGLDLIVADVQESSAWGAAMAGLLGLGVHASMTELEALPRQTQVYRPQMSADEVERNCHGWNAAVERVL